MVLIVKDDSTASINKCYRIYLYTYNNLAEDFFGGLKPTNLYRDIASREKLEQYLHLITQFNVYLDIVVRRKFTEDKKEELFEVYDGKISTID